MLAIVLKRRDYREADQIISFYSCNHGKLELLARGIKKITAKNSANLQLGAIVDIEVVKGKELNHLTKVSAHTVYKKFRNDLSKLVAVSFVLDFIDKATKIEEANSDIYSLLLSWMQYIEQSPLYAVSLKFSFGLKIIGVLGFSPCLDCCVVCGKIGENYIFNIKSGGLVCKKCQSGLSTDSTYPINKEDIEIITKMLNCSWDEVNDIKENRAAYKIIKEFINYYSEKNLII